MSKWRSGETSGSIAPSLAASRDSPSFTDGLHGEMMGKSWDGNGEIMGEKGSMINLHTLDKNGSLYDPAGTESCNMQIRLVT